MIEISQAARLTGIGRLGDDRWGVEQSHLASVIGHERLDIVRATIKGLDHEYLDNGVFVWYAFKTEKQLDEFMARVKSVAMVGQPYRNKASQLRTELALTYSKQFEEQLALAESFSLPKN